MKITFSHVNLCYPNPEQIAIEFEAETEFEAAYLKSLRQLGAEWGQVEGIHPGNSSHGRWQVRGKKPADKT